ncbi:Transmembrane emp24 domain-containing protein p24delta3 [Striga hermonthica]|uniref:Transmembrane emp24 domain-containing protein p24delta3 n=1 Tax=Striga hermonthica TaxID=68872 RepID=A0A9N7R949_STRHE|nr:Transmembrane emp24 domain-containing protein p24delta3 [Striga hermonthica]
MKLTAARRLPAVMLALSAAAPAARGILFDLASSGVKCVSEKLGNNAVVLVNFVALYGEHDNFNATLAPSISVKGLDLEIRKLEEAVDSIHHNMISMMHRQMDMTLVNLKMNVRVAHYSIVSIGLCISASVLHFGYLKRYFWKKKLI